MSKPALRYDFHRDCYIKDFGKDGKDIYTSDKKVMEDVRAGRVMVCCELPKRFLR